MNKFNRIKAVLTEHGKTSKRPTEQVSKSSCTVSKWCQNSIQPNLKTLNDITNLLNIDAKDLLVSKTVSSSNKI